MPRARVRACLLFLFVFVSSALGQQSGSARAVSDPKSAAGQDQSLADVARKLRDKKPVEVKMSGEDAKELFRSVDTIFTFAAEDTGFPRHSTVKRQLVGQADVEKFTRERLAKADRAGGAATETAVRPRRGLDATRHPRRRRSRRRGHGRRDRRASPGRRRTSRIRCDRRPAAPGNFHQSYRAERALAAHIVKVIDV